MSTSFSIDWPKTAKTEHTNAINKNVFFMIFSESGLSKTGTADKAADF